MREIPGLSPSGALERKMFKSRRSLDESATAIKD
jgi:hypothetical protein